MSIALYLTIVTALGLVGAIIFMVFRLNQTTVKLVQQEVYFNTMQQLLQTLQQQMVTNQHSQEKLQINQAHELEKLFASYQETLRQEHSSARDLANQQQLQALATIQDNLNNTSATIQQRLLDNLTHHTKQLDERVILLTQDIGQRLHTISQQVDKRLNDGFDKTTETFTRIVERLTIIDAAQKKITELSNNVVSLQELLADKRSRGAFGEVQLSGLLHNLLPENHFALQHTLSNGKRVDCMLFLPAPTGNVAIDSKFPLENYQVMINTSISEADKKLAEQRFRQDIKKHIADIADKYIIEGETADGAIMFIPAEAIFAEIHAHYADLVELAQKSRVWLASPTTLMAILTTARAVLKDAATRKQIHIIQAHLRALATDFGRFEKRMDLLSRHIHQAHEDVNEVKISATKITSRFNKIEQVELPDTAATNLPLE